MKLGSRTVDYQISFVYDYNKDKTVIKVEDKLHKLPRIHQLDFLKDATEQLLDLYNKKLDAFYESPKKESEKKIIEDMQQVIDSKEGEKDAIEERDEQKSIFNKREIGVKSRKTYVAGSRYSL
tara:strand:+ start:287 stop:655 length:369 start_codon:yes stop_codon:yes gene_type:complete